jgi:response regulator RpfG family c-di-GMP phosphodiesterase
MIQNVLIIDYDKLSVFLTKTTLERTTSIKNFESAENINEAINYLNYCLEKQKDSFPDLILFDLDKLGGNGWQFVDDFKALKHKIKKDIHIFMLSSTINKGDIVKAKNCAEITDFISKPIVKQDVDNLLSQIENKKNHQEYIYQ